MKDKWQNFIQDYPVSITGRSSGIQVMTKPGLKNNIQGLNININYKFDFDLDHATDLTLCFKYQIPFEYEVSGKIGNKNNKIRYINRYHYEYDSSIGVLKRTISELNPDTGNVKLVRTPQSYYIDNKLFEAICEFVNDKSEEYRLAKENETKKRNQNYLQKKQEEQEKKEIGKNIITDLILKELKVLFGTIYKNTIEEKRICTYQEFEKYNKADSLLKSNPMLLKGMTIEKINKIAKDIANTLE